MRIVAAQDLLPLRKAFEPSGGWIIENGQMTNSMLNSTVSDQRSYRIAFHGALRFKSPRVHVFAFCLYLSVPCPVHYI